MKVIFIPSFWDTSEEFKNASGIGKSHSLEIKIPAYKLKKIEGYFKQ